MYKISRSHDQDGHYAHIWKNPFKNLFLRKQKTNFNETWDVVLMTKVLECVHKSWTYDDTDLFYGKVNIGRI